MVSTAAITKNMKIVPPRPTLPVAALFMQQPVMLGQRAVGVCPEVSVQPTDCIIVDVTLAATASSTLNAHEFAVGNLSLGVRVRVVRLGVGCSPRISLDCYHIAGVTHLVIVSKAIMFNLLLRTEKFKKKV